MMASAMGRADIVEILLEAGADVRQRDTLLKKTAYAIKNTDMSDLLIWPAAGQTSLTLAVRRKHADVARLLLEAGADARAEDATGQSAEVLVVQSTSDELRLAFAEFLIGQQNQ